MIREGAVDRFSNYFHSYFRFVSCELRKPLPVLQNLASMAEEQCKQVNSESRPSLAKAAVKNFCEASTIHGISSIFSAESTVSRIFWIGMFVSVCSFLIWQISQLLQKLNANSVVIASRTLSEKELDFPVITFSNADPYSRAKLARFPQTLNGSRKLAHLRDLLSNFTSEEAKDIGGQLDYDCLFGSKSCFFTERIYPWLGNCWHFNFFSDQKQKNTGPKSGLIVIFTINESDYANTFDNGYGVYINIANSPFISLPVQRNKGILAAPGMLTRISMRKKKIFRLEHPYPDDCRKDSDVKELKGFHFKSSLKGYYSMDFCKSMSLVRNQMIRCGVVNPGYKFIVDNYLVIEKSNVSYKISGNSSEVDSIWGCLERVANEYVESGCRPLCNDYEFDFTISTLRWPSTQEAMDRLAYMKKHWPQTSAVQNWTVDSIYKNMLKIEIYFSDFDIAVIEQKPAYGLLDFASDLGGQVGLWIGASVYSVLEVLSLVVSLSYYMLQKANRAVAPKLGSTVSQKPTNGFQSAAKGSNGLPLVE